MPLTNDILRLMVGGGAPASATTEDLLRLLAGTSDMSLETNDLLRLLVGSTDKTLLTNDLLRLKTGSGYEAALTNDLLQAIQVAGGFAPKEAETTALLARMSVQPTATRAGQIDTLIKALKTAGVWAKMDCLYVMAAHDAQAARLNWKSASFNLTEVNAPTFTVDQGYQGNGTSSYLSLGVAPSGLTQYTLNSAHIAAWDRTTRTVAANKTSIGTGSGTSGCYIYPCATGPLAVTNINANSPVSFNVANSYGLTVGVRESATTVRIYRGATLLASSAASASGALSAQNISLLARNSTGTTFIEFSDDQLAAASAGASLLQADITAMNSALQTYLQAIGAA